jgi:cbb3-type cytochrome oxidase subunit 3
MIIADEYRVLEYQNESGMVYHMSRDKTTILNGLLLACCIFFIAVPAHAFTANSLDITVEKDGDAMATFRFTLEGFIENSIPQSILEEELKKGLTTSSDPPELISMDRSSAVLLLKKFADTSDVPTGTEYRTAMMDFTKAEAALQDSALSSAVSADFSPDKIVITFPDTYQREFSNVDVLPAVSHTVIDPSKTPAPVQTAAVPSVTAVPSLTGSMNVTSSPPDVKVYMDSVYIGEAPAVFPEIAAGTHNLGFEKDGYEPASRNVTINPGKTTQVLVVLRYIPPVPADDTSSFSGFFLIFLIMALVAIAGGAYYFWSEKRKRAWSEEEEYEEDAAGEKEPKGPDTASVSGDIVIKETTAKDTGISDTIVKVTMLRDMPDTDDTDAPDTSK